MNLAIQPSYLEWLITVNPAGKVLPREVPGQVMPWMYAPWPEAATKGIVEIESVGETLRELLKTLSNQYRQVNIDCHPVDKKTKRLDPDYDVFINNDHVSDLPAGLDTRLNDGDEVKVRFLFRWDG